MNFSILLHGCSEFKSLAMQNFCLLFKYLNAMTNYQYSLSLLECASTSERVSDHHIGLGYYLEFERGLNTNTALINRFKLGQSDFRIDQHSINNLRCHMANFVYVIVQSDYIDDLRMIRPQLSATRYKNKSVRYIALSNDEIKIMSEDELVFECEPCHAEQWTVLITSAVKMIQKATQQGKFTSTNTYPIKI